MGIQYRQRIGLIMGILGFKDLHKGATESWSGSSSSSSSGLKTASFTDSGTLYHLTQDSPIASVIIPTNLAANGDATVPDFIANK